MSVAYARMTRDSLPVMIIVGDRVPLAGIRTGAKLTASSNDTET